MKLLLVFCASAGLLLGSAAPPPSLARERKAPEPPPAPPKEEILLRAPPPTLVLEEVAAPRPKPPAPKRPAPARELREAPLTGDVRVVVSLSEQKAYVFQGDELLASSPVSTGKRGHETPVGTFRILQKKVHHRSSKYENAPMPYMQRLTNYGIALHAGRLPGYPASHGCIRLPWGFAKKLYGLTGHGTSVTVTRDRPRLASRAEGNRRTG